MFTLEFHNDWFCVASCDDVLRLDHPEGVIMIGFVENLAVVIAADDVAELNCKKLLGIQLL